MEKAAGRNPIYDEEFKQLVSRMSLDPELCQALRSYYEESAYPCKIKAIWLFVHAARQQDKMYWAHKCELALVHLLKECNFQQHLKESLVSSSWEMKLVLIVYFARNGRAIISGATWPRTSQLLRRVVQAFKEESHSRFGIELNCTRDLVQFYDAMRNTSRENIGKAKSA